MSIELGQKARDKVTGFTGMVISYHKYLNGCVRLGIQPTQLNKDGKPYDPEVFDIEQLELAEEPTPSVLRSSTGGPRREPARPAVPKR